MKTLEAMRATLELAKERDFDMIGFEEEGVDFDHLKSMVDRAEDPASEFSEGKINRWLGYMQGVLVATSTCTLEEVKELNRRFAD